MNRKRALEDYKASFQAHEDKPWVKSERAIRGKKHNYETIPFTKIRLTWFSPNGLQHYSDYQPDTQEALSVDHFLRAVKKAEDTFYMTVQKEPELEQMLIRLDEDEE